MSLFKVSSDPFITKDDRFLGRTVQSSSAARARSLPSRLQEGVEQAWKTTWDHIKPAPIHPPLPDEPIDSYQSYNAATGMPIEMEGSRPRPQSASNGPARAGDSALLDLSISRNDIDRDPFMNRGIRSADRQWHQVSGSMVRFEATAGSGEPTFARGARPIPLSESSLPPGSVANTEWDSFRNEIARDPFMSRGIRSADNQWHQVDGSMTRLETSTGTGEPILDRSRLPPTEAPSNELEGELSDDLKCNDVANDPFMSHGYRSEDKNWHMIDGALATFQANQTTGEPELPRRRHVVIREPPQHASKADPATDLIYNHSTVLIADAKAGDRRLEVESIEGLAVGDTILVGAEVNAIAGIGSIELVKPLKHDHPAGTLVAKLETYNDVARDPFMTRGTRSVDMPYHTIDGNFRYVELNSVTGQVPEIRGSRPPLPEVPRRSEFDTLALDPFQTRGHRLRPRRWAPTNLKNDVDVDPFMTRGFRTPDRLHPPQPEPEDYYHVQEYDNVPVGVSAGNVDLLKYPFLADHGRIILTVDAKVGDTRIEVSSVDGLEIGDTISIGSELNTIAGFGSIELGKPLENDHLAGTLISKVEVYKPPPPPDLPAPHICPYWYRSENNWNMCRAHMDDAFKQVKQEFSGEQFQDERVVQSRLDGVKQGLFMTSGGLLGSDEEATRTANVVDVFEDWQFPGDDSAWFRLDDGGWLSNCQAPNGWRRLLEFSEGAPYPTTDFEEGIINPRPGRVYQGKLEDFYLAQALQAISMKPSLVKDVFSNMEFSSTELGCYTIRLYKHAQWMSIMVDDALPLDSNNEPLCMSSEYWPNWSWPALIEKAYAKIHGSWEGLGGGGHPEEAMSDLTGGCASRFSTRDMAPDRMWQYVAAMMPFCVFGCNIDDNAMLKRCIPIEKHWASAIYATQKKDGVPYICICTSAPTISVRHLPACNLPSAEGYGVAEGFAWLCIDDFVELFDTIYECRLVNSHVVPSLTPGWLPDYPWFEEIWAYQGHVYGETAPSFFIDVANAPCEIVMGVSQTDHRYCDRRIEDSEDADFSRAAQVPLLISFYQTDGQSGQDRGGEICSVHCSAWGHCRDAMCVVKVLKPGRYLAMVTIPMRYMCDRMIFRTYSQPYPVKTQYVEHRAFTKRVYPAPPDAIPFSIVGWQQSATNSGCLRLPASFDDDESKGNVANHWMKDVQNGINRSLPMSLRRNEMGLKVVGEIGGPNAVATTEAREAQDVNCSVM